MGGYSWGYVRAWRSLADSATAPERLREVRGRVTVLARRPDAFAAVCRDIQNCREHTLPASDSYAWATDPGREAWLEALEAAIRTR